MDTLIISNENNILHIFNDGYSCDYTLYNSKGHSMDGGVLEFEENVLPNVLTEKIIKIIKDKFLFNSPFTCLTGDKAQNLLELIEIEDYKNLRNQIENKSVIDKDKNDIEINI